jgi:hypothetical protein
MPALRRAESIGPSVGSPGVPLARAVFVILRIGVVAGTLDITDAFVFNAFRHITPMMVLQYIASGLIRRRIV